MKKLLSVAACGLSKLVPVPRQSKYAPAFTLTACAVLGVIVMLAIPVAAAQPTKAEQLAVDFDTETLKARGIDPKLADYFRLAPKFTQGEHVVTLRVNAMKVGRVSASFDAEGQLCFDDTLLAKAGLRTPDEYILPNGMGSDKRCYDFVAAYPQTEVALHPNKEEVAIVVSQDALIGNTPKASDFTRGGFAAIVNYDLMGIRSSSGVGSNDYLSASTQLGFNMGDWIVRSRQIFTKDGDRASFDPLYAYAQHTFVDQKVVLQAGQININSPLFTGAPITGVQILPERALAGSAHSGALVEGIAHSQATVEVRQAGVLLFSTMVPEGPFMLQDVCLLNMNTDLDVTVRETSGAERHFIVSAASFRSSAPAAPGSSFAIGKVRDVSGGGVEQPLVATATRTWQLSRDVGATAGGMLSARYQAIGWGADARIGNDVSMNVRNVVSNALDDGVNGMQISAALTLPLSHSIAASLSTTRQTLGYRDFSDTLVRSDGDDYHERYKSRHTASLSWSNQAMGSVSVLYSANKTFNGRSDDRLSGSWGWQFKQVTITASLETSLCNRGTNSGNARAAYLSVSIPLGKRSVRTYARQRGDDLSTGVAMSDTVSDQLNYRFAAEHNNSSGSTYASGNVSVLPRYTAVDLSYSQSASAHVYSGRISGGAVVHRSGVTLSPYPVQDTFGIVKVPDVSGVKLSTPQGPVWTDISGQAVVPMLNAYRNSRIEVQTKSLPRRVDLRNGFQEVDAGRGSVNFMSFDVIQARRYLVSAVDDEGLPLPKGASVVDAMNNYLTTVLDSGSMFLSDAGPESALQVSLPDGQACKLTIDFPKETDNDAFYDQVSAICRR